MTTPDASVHLSVASCRCDGICQNSRMFLVRMLRILEVPDSSESIHNDSQQMWDCTNCLKVECLGDRLQWETHRRRTMTNGCKWKKTMHANENWFWMCHFEAISIENSCIIIMNNFIEHLFDCDLGSQPVMLWRNMILRFWDALRRQGLSWLWGSLRLEFQCAKTMWTPLRLFWLMCETEESKCWFETLWAFMMKHQEGDLPRGEIGLCWFRGIRNFEDSQHWTRNMREFWQIPSCP